MLKKSRYRQREFVGLAGVGPEKQVTHYAVGMH
jgi:hypothetical protein